MIGGSDGCKVPLVIDELTCKSIVRVECGSQFSMALSRYGVLYTWFVFDILPQLIMIDSSLGLVVGVKFYFFSVLCHKEKYLLKKTNLFVAWKKKFNENMIYYSILRLSMRKILENNQATINATLDLDID